MDIPTELRGRVVANTGFDYTSTIFILADDSNIDIQLQVYAPGLATDEFDKLCLTIGDRLRAALVGLNDETIVEIHHGDEFNHFRVVINNPDHVGSKSATNDVMATATAIAQASEHGMHRRVFTLKRWECAVLVDWDEPFVTTRKEFTLSLPAEATGLNVEQRCVLLDRMEALCDNGTMVSVRTHGITPESRGTVEIALWSTPISGIDVHTARAHVARILFVLGTVVKLAGINNMPVIRLTRPFTPFVDDGSEPRERNIEY